MQGEKTHKQKVKLVRKLWLSQKSECCVLCVILCYDAFDEQDEDHHYSFKS